MELTEPGIETSEITAKPPYDPPQINVLDADEVLKMFQMTASEISAAGCWWNGG
jgi:hypothetical protein